MKQNLIIRASAGTGKTFSLATRFIRLMLFEDADPKAIVALTFSRAAAKEIYTKLLERLWKAALSAGNAAAEEVLLKKGLSDLDLETLRRKKVAFTQERFAELLRKTVDSQEVGAIATLDSFILRIVRSFPLEMGFQHAVEVLDEFGEKAARARVGEDLLADDSLDDKGRAADLAAAFRASQRGIFRRACQTAFERVLREWHAFLVDHPEARTWTADSMCAALGIPEDVRRPDLSAVCGSGKRNDPIDGAAEWISGFTGEEKLFPKNKTGELMRFLEANPDESVYRYLTESGKEKVIDCGAAGAAAIRDGIRWMVATALRRQVEVVAAKLDICKLFDGDYDTATRRRGQLTFADFTHCQALAEGGANPLALENIQYRFDERFTHWALDEFQDTSKLQWKCLERLVSEAAGGEQRSVMVVGDLKQSIYGWRGGDDGPFREVMAMGAFRGERGESLKNDVSYRYEKHTVDFINRVFGPGNLKDAPLLNGACAGAVRYWLDEGCWMEHKPDVYAGGKERAGRFKDGDYVEIVRVARPTDGGEDAADAQSEDVSSDEEEGARCSAAMRILAPKVCALVKELWRRHEEVRGGSPSTDTIGILVRNNVDGAYLAERLRSLPDADLPVVWEGVNTILDAPAVQATLELLKLASHPEDTFAWVSVDRLFPVRRLVFPDLATAADVSRRMGGILTRLGLSRTLRAVVSKLSVPEAGLSARSVACLESLVRLAVAFEAREEGGAALEAFPKFLAVSAGRDSGESSRVVRILTMHRSKGLTLDHVIVPIPESGSRDAITEPDPRQRLEGEGWALGMPSEDLARCNPVLAAAWEKKADEHFMEQLRLNYVALTRARKSTYVFVVDDAHDGVVQFRDVLLAPFLGAEAQPTETRAYGEVVFADGTPFGFGYPDRVDGKSGSPEHEPWTHAAGVPSVARRTPSAAGSAVATMRAVNSMAVFFSKDFGAAAEKGIAAHAAYAKIAWIDPGAPRNELEARILASGLGTAFVKPENGATVWCERGYELFDPVSSVWESGQFDRVVFTGEGGNRSATIYDFKTNARRPDENEDAFAARMRTLYAPQMEAYRAALHRLTGIPPDRIRTVLLLVSGGQAVPV